MGRRSPRALSQVAGIWRSAVFRRLPAPRRYSSRQREINGLIAGPSRQLLASKFRVRPLSTVRATSAEAPAPHQAIRISLQPDIPAFYGPGRPPALLRPERWPCPTGLASYLSGHLLVLQSVDAVFRTACFCGEVNTAFLSTKQTVPPPVILGLFAPPTLSSATFRLDCQAGHKTTD